MPAATRIAITSTRRISFSTNGCTKLVGSRSSVMKPVRPLPLAGLGDLLLRGVGAGRGGAPASKPAPGLMRLPASRPRPSATTVATKK